MAEYFMLNIFILKEEVKLAREIHISTVSNIG